MNKMIIILLVLLASVFSAVGSLYLKRSSAKITRNIKKIIANHQLFIGIALFLISTLVYMFALKSGTLSMVYPLSSLSYVWVSLLSIKFLGEKMNTYKWLGIIFIIIGVFLIVN